MHALFWPLSDILCGAQMIGGFLADVVVDVAQDPPPVPAEPKDRTWFAVTEQFTKVAS
jgi:hypothetical protein